jgi:hypothetical protein
MFIDPYNTGPIYIARTLRSAVYCTTVLWHAVRVLYCLYNTVLQSIILYSLILYIIWNAVQCSTVQRRTVCCIVRCCTVRYSAGIII